VALGLQPLMRNLSSDLSGVLKAIPVV